MPSKTSPAKRITAPDVLAAKGGEPLVVITAYDYATARIADQAGVDIVLVGDSLAMVMLGHEDTLSVTMDEMLHHTRAVARGLTRPLLVGDMPFMSYQPSVETALRNAGRMLSEGGARAVKLEGGRPFAPHARAMVDAGIPVMGHIGLTPQHIAAMGGFKTQGKTAEAVHDLVDDAKALEDAGVFSIVLEAMPVEAARAITEAISVPTIGIGAGNACDGQVLVVHDVLGLFDRFTPRFVKRYLELGVDMKKALETYAAEVRSRAFPAEEHTWHLKDEEQEKL